MMLTQLHVILHHWNRGYS